MFVSILPRKAILEMTYTVLGRTLSPTHSQLIHYIINSPNWRRLQLILIAAKHTVWYSLKIYGHIKRQLEVSSEFTVVITVSAHAQQCSICQY